MAAASRRPYGVNATSATRALFTCRLRGGGVWQQPQCRTARRRGARAVSAARGRGRKSGTQAASRKIDDTELTGFATNLTGNPAGAAS